MSDDLLDALARLVEECDVRLDRPRGSVHPHHPEVVYPLDYGYLDGTDGGDGDGIDVFVGTAAEAGVVGVAFVLDARKRELEAKVLLDCTAAETELAIAFLRDVLHLTPHLVRR